VMVLIWASPLVARCPPAIDHDVPQEAPGTSGATP
jgi:hypothetical protein